MPEDQAATNVRQDNSLSDEAVKSAIETIRTWYGLNIPPDAMRKPIENDEDLLRDAVECNGVHDTLPREWLSAEIAEFLTGTTWPCNGDSDEVKAAFYDTLVPKARELGWLVEDRWSRSDFVS